MNKLAVIENEIYDVETLIVFNSKWADIAKWLRKNTGYTSKEILEINKALDVEAVARTLQYKNCTIVWFKEYDNRPYDHGIVAHEVYHLVEYIFKDRDIELCVCTSEPAAYLIGYYTRKIIELYDVRPKRKRL